LEVRAAGRFQKMLRKSATKVDFGTVAPVQTVDYIDSW
jgi:hypothetical protein